MPAALLALTLLAAACASAPAESADGIATADGSRSKKASTATGSSDPQQAALDFAECMREHGVDMPDPQADGGGLVVVGPTGAAGATAVGGTVAAAPGPPEGFEAAHEACKHFLEELIQDRQAAMDPEAQDRALKFAQCMRDHGVDMPDPDFSAGGVRIELGGNGLDPTSDTFKKAQEACGTAFGPGGGGSAPGVRIGGGRS